MASEIEKLKGYGFSRKEILDTISKGGDKWVNRTQLENLGYRDKAINDYLTQQRQRLLPVSSPPPPAKPKPPASGGGSTGGGGASSPTPAPADPYEMERQRQAERESQSAFSMLSNILNQYGLGSLTPMLQNLIQGGMTDAATLQLELQNTNEWKQRFKGNEILRQQGLGVLSPAEYLNLERSYASVMRQFGLPAGFYDSPEDFANIIGNNVSPAELAERAQQATELAKQTDPTQRQLLSSMYGIGEGDIAAYFLDAKRAQPLLQKQLNAVRTGAAARRAGIEADYGNAARFERLNDQGVNPEMAAQGYGQIAREFDTLRNLSKVWGGGNDWTLDDAERATFFGNDDATRERQRLVSQEKAAFSGASGFRSGVSGRRSSAGQF